MTLTSFAQAPSDDYRPFVEEGKGFDLHFGEILENSYQHWMDGDTVINGETWKKVYNSLCRPHLDYRYFLSLREKDKKVYALPKGSHKPRLLYDFNLKVGSILRCGIEGNSFLCLLDSNEQPDSLFGFEFKAFLRVESIDTVEACGIARRRFKMTMLDPYKEYFKHEDNGGVFGNIVWVEGVGSGAGPFAPWEALPPPFFDVQSSGILFIDYYYGRTPFFLHDAFYDNDSKASAIRPTRQAWKGFSTPFDLQGRRLATQLRRGLYIKDGRKMVAK